MKQFEGGKTYLVNGRHGETITIDRRTPCYVTFSGGFSGRLKVRKGNLFGLGEHVFIPAGRHGYFCFAGHEV